MGNKKIYYLDNLKVLLTALVVMHHSFVTYGAPGGWYYKGNTDRFWGVVVCGGLAGVYIIVCCVAGFSAGGRRRRAWGRGSFVWREGARDAGFRAGC